MPDEPRDPVMFNARDAVLMGVPAKLFINADRLVILALMASGTVVRLLGKYFIWYYDA
jgi:hypothetical protein